MNLGILFKKIVKKNKFNCAIHIQDRNYSYLDLDYKSDQIAYFLKSKKINCGQNIVILSKKRFEVFCLIIACLKIGVSYTFLDRNSPMQRNLKIIKNLNSKAIFTDTNNKKKINKKSYNIEKIRTLKKIKFTEIASVKSNNLAYIMFTSGSTGTPKGVMITHQNLINFISWGKREYKISNKSTLSNLNSLYFDNSIFDIFCSLFNGAKLVPFHKSETIDSFLIKKKFNEQKINIWFSVPSLIIFMMNFIKFDIDNFKYLQKIIFGGEPFSKIKLKKLFLDANGKIKLFNVYGPTECTCICSSYKISKIDFTKKEMNKFAPLGKKMIKIFDYSIVDGNLKKVKKGVCGNLLLHSQNVGIGYINNKEENIKKFFLNPFKKKYKEKSYLTGDIVYKDKQSNKIYFVGRKDRQIKISGYRIELDEIEEVINSINGVNQSFVNYIKIKKNTKSEIICWVCTKKNIQFLINKLKNKLPKYMLPSKFIKIKKIPLNANGKIDRKKLKYNL